MGAAVEVEGVSKRYGGVNALRECSVVIPRGCTSALVGLNGAGKTTLIRALASLIPVDAGTIRVSGTHVAFGRPGHVAYLAQSRPLPATLRAQDACEYAAAMASPGFDLDRSLEWLDAFGVDRGKQVARLSGGQRTHVAIAITIGLNRDVVALDEPMADLDPLAREAVADRLRREAADGRTTIVSSHAVAELSNWCDHVVVMHAGTVLLSGYVSEVAPTGDLETVVLGLLRSAHQSDVARGAGQ